MKEFLNKMASIATELDKNGYNREADIMTQIMVRMAWHQPIGFRDSSGNMQAYLVHPEAGAVPPSFKGMLWSNDNPPVLRKPQKFGSNILREYNDYISGRTEQRSKELKYNSYYTSLNPSTPERVYEGVEYSPQNKPQTPGYGKKWRIEQTRKKFGLPETWVPKGETAVPQRTQPIGKSVPATKPSTWQQNKTWMKEPTKISPQQHQNINPQEKDVQNAVVAYLGMFSKLKTMYPDRKKYPIETLIQYTKNHAQSRQSPQFVAFLANQLRMQPK